MHFNIIPREEDMLRITTFVGLAIVGILGISLSSRSAVSSSSAYSQPIEASFGIVPHSPGTQGSDHNSPPSALGLRCMIGQSSIRVLDVLWGISMEDVLGPAFIRYETEDGRVIERDNSEHCKAIFTSPAEIKNAYMYFGSVSGARIYLESITFGATERGFLSLQSFVGRDDEGALRSYNSTALPIVCQFIGSLSCFNHTCTGDCPAAPPCTCSATGRCWEALVQVCPDTGSCVAPSTCKISGVNCGCY